MKIPKFNSPFSSKNSPADDADSKISQAGAPEAEVPEAEVPPAESSEVEVADAAISHADASEIEFHSSDDSEFEAEITAPELELAPAQESVAAMQPLATLHENAKFLQDLATRIWRAQKQLDKALANSDEAQLERFARRFEEVGETLNDYGVEILDHTGQNYDVGLNLTVLQFEPTPGISRETICETIKPSLRIHGALVPGQVIVASPIAADLEEVAIAELV